MQQICAHGAPTGNFAYSQHYDYSLDMWSTGCMLAGGVVGDKCKWLAIAHNNSSLWLIYWL
jgi:hypothetical protein